MEKKLNIFYMKNDCVKWNDDCSFYLETDAPKEVVEEIVWFAIKIHNGASLEEIQEVYGNKYDDDWDKYSGFSAYEVLFYMLEDKGYVAYEKNFGIIK